MTQDVIPIRDALYNWLTIKNVAEARPEDDAAWDTFSFFDEILAEDHNVEKIEVEKDNVFYTVHYWVAGEEQTEQFAVPMIDALLRSIEAEPKYNEQ